MADPWSVPPALDGERVDRALSLVTGLSRSEVNGLIDAGRVRVGRRLVEAHSRRVRAGELVDVEGELLVPYLRLEPDPGVEVTVVWSDDEVIVVDKPAGLVVHPGAGNSTGTLVHGLLARFPDLASLDTGPADGDRDPVGFTPGRPGIVHRLDKGTSGLLVVARTTGAMDALAGQLSDRTMSREYIALVAGWMESDAGVIDGPLGRSTADPTRIRVQAGGRFARTGYQVSGRSVRPVPLTLIRCKLETGRTHQIRVHLASIGHPVVGDDRYGGRRAAGWRPLPAGRPFLHAAMLEFDHPATSERMRFTSVLPRDLRDVLGGVDPSWVDEL
jgi:23S rRNA pseudouridine1911/1915/1917 synthase